MIMENEEKILKINYANSGVKTARYMGSVFFNLGILLLFVSVILVFALIEDSTSIVVVVGVFVSALSCFIFGSILCCISTIAEAALIKKHKFKSDYLVVDSKKLKEIK
jgi:hypothetical protein